MRSVRRPLAIASDHAGLEMKRRLVKVLEEWGYGVKDLGPGTADSVDYPDYAEAVALRVSSGQAPVGVLICGTGIGMSIAANKFPGVRAALLYDDFSARYSRLHNDANVAILGARTTAEDAAVARLGIFLAEPFEKGRHARRVKKIGNIEKRLGREA